MKSPVSAQAIQQQLDGDIAACNQLINLLDEEQEALKNRDAEALGRVIEAKIAPLTRLEESAKQRAQWANAKTNEQSSEKWETMLSSIDQKKLKSDWDTFKTLTQQCREKNEINGKVLSRHQQIYGRLVDLMRGQTAAPNLYDASGAASSRAYSNKVGEA